MKKEILQNKKEWSGEDIGKALLLSLVSDYAPKESFAAAITQQELDVLVAALYKGSDKRDYTIYLMLYKGLTEARSLAQTNESHLYIGYLQTMLFLKDIEHSEKLRLSMLQYPATLTEKDFNAAFKKKKKELLKIKISYAEIVWGAFAFYAGKYSKRKPKTPGNIKDILCFLTPIETTRLLNINPHNQLDVKNMSLFIQKEYDKLYLALSEDILSKPFFKNIKKEDDDAAPICSFEDLVNQKLYIYPKSVDAICPIKIVQDRGLFDEIRSKNGVAVIKLAPQNPTKNGEPLCNLAYDEFLSEPDALESTFNSIEKREQINIARKDLLLKSHVFLLAYNQLLKIMGDVFKIPTLKNLEIAPARFIEKLDDTEKIIEKIPSKFENMNHSAAEKKLQFDAIYPKLNPASFVLDKDAEKIVKSHLQNVKTNKVFPVNLVSLISNMAGFSKETNQPIGEVSNEKQL